MDCFRTSSEQYVQVPDDELEKSSTLSRPRPAYQGRRFLGYVVVLHLLLAFTSLKLFLAGKDKSTVPSLWARELPFAKDAVSYEEVTFKPSGFSETSEPATPYEGRPTAATNALWHKLINVGMYALTASEYAQLDLETATVVGSGNGNGESEYIVTIEVFHQLHCLNYLRLRAYEEGPDKKFNPLESDRSRQQHLSHCIDYLRQVLMCHSDLTLITLTPAPSRMPPYMPDFNIKHTCRDFDKIWEFASLRNTTGITIE